MPGAFESGLLKRFLEELSDSLDVHETIKKLGITEKEARGMLETLARREGGRGGKGGGGGRHAELPLPFHKGHPGKAHPHDIYVDGASRGNPGKAGAGAVIKDSDGGVVKELRYYLGVTTNNVAEYRALVSALEEARKMGLEDIRVHADSELMVRQLNGEYRVKSAGLLPLYERVVELSRGFRSFKIAHIPREKNRRADELANEAIDRGD